MSARTRRCARAHCPAQAFKEMCVRRAGACVLCAAVLKRACAARTGSKSGVCTSGSAKSASGSLSVRWLGLWEAAREHTEPIIIRYGRPTVIISNTHSCSALLFAATLKAVLFHFHVNVHVRVATQSPNVHAWKVQCGRAAMAALVSVAWIYASVEMKSSLRGWQKHVFFIFGAIIFLILTW